MIERRHLLRIPISIPIKFRRVDYVAEQRNISKDLSVKGIRFLSQEFVPVSTHIKVEIKLREDAPAVKFIAKTAWIKSLYGDELYEIGARICEIGRDSSSFLSKLF